MRTILLIIISFHFLMAQKPFEGKITYNVNLIGRLSEKMKNMMPDSQVIICSKNGLIQKQYGGVSEMSGSILIKDSLVFLVQAKTQTYFELTDDRVDSTKKMFKTTQSNEFVTLLGLKGQKYKYEAEINFLHLTEIIWLNKDWKLEIQIPFIKNNKKLLTGLPIKIETEMGDMYKIVYTISKIEFYKPDNQLFEIPSGFQKGYLGYGDLYEE